MRASKVVTYLAVPAVAVAAWWIASAGSDSIYFPPLQTIVQAFRDTWVFERFASDIVPSVFRVLAGFGIAVVVGVVLGVLLGRIRRLDDALEPTLQFVRAIPAVALIPLVIVLLGIGDAAKISLIAFACVFPILLNTIDGVRNVETGLEDVGRSFRLTRRQRIVAILLPSAMPQIFAGTRIALAVAVILGIVTELTGATNGIGFVTLEAQQTFDIPVMWSGMLLLGLLGSLLNGIFMLIEHRVLRWHYKSRAGV